jgi:hypothetical protein
MATSRPSSFNVSMFIAATKRRLPTAADSCAA